MSNDNNNIKKINSNDILDTTISLITTTSTISEITITTTGTGIGTTGITTGIGITSTTIRSTVIYNLSSMIYYCITQNKENLNNNSNNNNNNNDNDNNSDNLSNYFNDYENINKWDVINIENYLWNSIEDSQIDYSTIIVAIIYLNRLLKSHQNEFYLTSGNWRNVVSTCFLIASKMFDDLGMSNADFRNIFPTTELSRVNSFELKICLLLDFTLYVPDKEFLVYRRRYESNPTPSSSRRNSRRMVPYVAPSLSSLAYYETTKEETEHIIPQSKDHEPIKQLNNANTKNNTSDFKKSLSTPCSDSINYNSNNINNNNNNNANNANTRHSFIGSLHQGFRNYFGTNSEVKNPMVKRRKSAVDKKKVYCI